MALNDVINTVKDVNNTVQTVKDATTDPYGFVRNKLLPSDAMQTSKSVVAARANSSIGKDWRVRLSVPSQFSSSPVLAPLRSSSNSLVFPFTPTIIMQHSASYSELHPVHTNYPYPVYENSRIDDIQITGEFYVENSADAEYWIAAVHFLRSVSKMFYGQTTDQGSPPPITKLNGYGDYVFKDLPTVVSMFNVTLDPEVNYIKAEVPGVAGADSWAPSFSTIAVNLKPVYSRNNIRTFKLDDFVNGSYVLDSQGRGFI